MTTSTTKTPLERMLDAFPQTKGPRSSGWYYHENNPTFDFRVKEDGSISIHPWTHHTVEDILAGVKLSNGDLYRFKRPSTFTLPAIDIVSLAHARRIHWQFLYSLGLSDEYKYHGRRCVRIPYHLPHGEEHTKIKVRKTIDGKYKHSWDEGTPGEVIPYGLHRLHMASEQGYLLIGEGESDAWACWLHDVPYLGLPGASTAKKLTTYDIDLSLIPRIYILHEPDQVKSLQNKGVGFYKDVHNTLREIGYTGEIFCVHFKQLTGCKDPGDLHISLWDQEGSAQFKTAILDAIQRAIPSGDEDQASPPPSISGHTEIDAAIASGDRQAIYKLSAEIAQLPELTRERVRVELRTVWGNTFPMREFDDLLREERIKIAREKQLSPEIYSARDLMRKQFKPVNWAVPGIAPVGLIALAGKQKIGKSWLDLGLCLGVAAGGMVFGSIRVEQGDTLYLALEDNERRMQDRILALLGPVEEPSECFDYALKWPRMDADGLIALEKWIVSRKNPRMIIIDPWVKVKPRIKQRAGETGYDADYEALEGLKALADKYNVCIIVQFHLRKQGAEDPFDELNGTSGITACADGFLSLKRSRGEADATLWGTGRDYKDDVDLALKFSNGFWNVLGNATEYALSQASKEVIDVLNAADKPLQPKEIAERLGVPVGTIRKRLLDMKKRDEVKDTDKGYIANIGNGGNGGNASNRGNASNADHFDPGNVTPLHDRYLDDEEEVTPVNRRGKSSYTPPVIPVTPVTTHSNNATYADIHQAYVEAEAKRTPEEQEAIRQRIQREWDSTHPPVLTPETSTNYPYDVLATLKNQYGIKKSGCLRGHEGALRLPWYNKGSWELVCELCYGKGLRATNGRQCYVD
jgi:hypothetical protein